MRVRLSENAPKADSKNANPVPAMVEVAEPVRASGSCVCGAGTSSVVSSCAGSGSVTGVGTGSGSEIIGTGIGSGLGSGVVTGVGSGSGFGVDGTTGGFGGSGFGGSGFGLVTVKYVTDIPIVFVYVFGT